MQLLLHEAKCQIILLCLLRSVQVFSEIQSKPQVEYISRHESCLGDATNGGRNESARLMSAPVLGIVCSTPPLTRTSTRLFRVLLCYLPTMPPMAFTGIVTKVGVMNKTATVTVSRLVAHPRTGKMLERSKKFLTHDENNQLRLHDQVVIRNCPPISARKRFKLETILKSPEREREEHHRQLAEEAAAKAKAQPQVATA